MKSDANKETEGKCGREEGQIKISIFQGGLPVG